MCYRELPSHFHASAQLSLYTPPASPLYSHNVFSASPKDFACMKVDPSIDQSRLTELFLHFASMWRAALDHNGLIVSVSSLLIMLVFRPLVKNAILMGRSIRSASHALVSLLAHDDSAVFDDAAPARARHCERCARRGEDELSHPDVVAVMASLGLVVGRNEEEEDEQVCGWCGAMEAMEELVESKVAGEGELREAFYVFDRDEDGFVCAAELWNVLRRLGMEEGAGYEDCRSMIAAYDGDGDGRISFQEFRAMMENAV